MSFRMPFKPPVVPEDFGGLAPDLEAIMARRRALLLMGGAGVGLLAGCSGGGGGASATDSLLIGATPTPTPTSTPTPTPTPTSGSTPTSASCVAHARETNGPYPSDGSNNANGSNSNMLTTSGIVRSDIRSSFAGLSGTAEGVLLTLTMTVANTNNSCAALAGYAVYIWHNDASGRYSIYQDSDQNWLRGVGVTDSNGQVTFTTIFPGCYSGRYPHIHFEVFPSLTDASHVNNSSLISQLVMPDAICTSIYNSDSRYSGSVGNFNRITVGSDGVFGNNSSDQIEAMTVVMSGSASSGYTGNVTVGLAV